MENMNNTKEMVNETFNYTYSSETQKEIENITKKYQPLSENEDKMEQLRKLDRSTSKPGTIASVAIGSVSSLIFGSGMSMCLVGSGTLFIPGIVVGVLGVVGMALALPVYHHVTKKQRAKNATAILKLAEEISA